MERLDATNRDGDDRPEKPTRLDEQLLGGFAHP